MADEIAVSCSLRVSKNGASISASSSTTFDLSGSDMYQATQSFGTSEDPVEIGSCAQVAHALIKNLDASATLTIGLDDPITQVLSVIQPGDAAKLSGIATTFYGKSSSGTIAALVAISET